MHLANAVRIISTEDPKLQWIDRAKAIMEFATRAGTAWLGYQAFEKQEKGAGLSGAIVSQIALRLAESNNDVGGAAGVATLSGMGILNVLPEPAVTYVSSFGEWVANLFGIDPSKLMFPNEEYTPGEYDPYTGRFD